MENIYTAELISYDGNVLTVAPSVPIERSLLQKRCTR